MPSDHTGFKRKERKRTQERCVLLKRMHAQPWLKLRVRIVIDFVETLFSNFIIE